jgi:hypothetical protein
MAKTSHLRGSFEEGDAFFEDVGGWVLEAGVDVAKLLEREEVGGVFGAVELEGGSAVNRDGTGVCGGVGFVATVDAEGFEFHNGG